MAIASSVPQLSIVVQTSTFSGLSSETKSRIRLEAIQYKTTGCFKLRRIEGKSTKETELLSSSANISLLGTSNARRKALARAATTDVTTDEEKSSNVSMNKNPIFPKNVALVEASSDKTIEDNSWNSASSSSAEGSTSPERIAFDYGFQAKFLRKDASVPSNFFKLAFENFRREWRALRRSYLFTDLETIDVKKVEGGPIGVVTAFVGRGIVLFLRRFDKALQYYDGLPELKDEKPALDEGTDGLRSSLKGLTLSNEAVWERERSRPPVKAPWWILGPYYILCTMLDIIFKDRPIQRFWFLETVARMPYFSYISMLHLYETLGWWRVGAEVRKVHFAEEWNEMHHLKIMESLGGDLEWGDRFFGQHAAFFYYWILNFMFLISPKVAYNFSELIEMHAVDTYGEFVDENEALLKTLPPPPVALDYYESEDLYMYDEFQTSNLPETRRPNINSLYDVFVAIKGDEYEHVKTMVACQQLNTKVVSPHKAKVAGEKVP